MACWRCARKTSVLRRYPVGRRYQRICDRCWQQVTGRPYGQAPVDRRYRGRQPALV